ncbi:unnamed protein product [Bursaphelenchus xylophilus]|uniref:(pine wood nematode) hypothetical protein n=1 Tax=Bursaphelenchus xylophilus TaxID=6326 RepID=A0A1I7S784_BURXY|nr:unnamed protein product [Bursaphelenchus xylophilus]CAG9084744.1 unnamed protein product [Bursaphelenchus xylophilus]
MPNDVLLCRFRIGHETELLDKPTSSGHTHRWKVFVRSPENCPELVDRSYVRKVTFVLHDSFSNPKRTVRNPPFEITETGYGGFDMVIILHLQNCQKSFSISYEISLPMEKHSTKFLDHRVEIKNPEKELVDLSLKYGAKLSKRKEKSEKPEKQKEKSGDDKKRKTKPEKDKVPACSTPTGSQKVNKPEGKIKIETLEVNKEKAEKKNDKLEIKVQKEDTIGEPKSKKPKKSKSDPEKTMLSVDDLFNPAPLVEKSKGSIRSEKTKPVKTELKKELMAPNDNQQVGSSKMQIIDVQSKESIEMMDKVSELSSLPNILSPVNRNMVDSLEQSAHLKDVIRRLYVKFDPEKYRLPMLKKLNTTADVIRRYERPIPLLTFEDQLSVTVEGTD